MAGVGGRRDSDLVVCSGPCIPEFPEAGAGPEKVQLPPDQLIGASSSSCRQIRQGDLTDDPFAKLNYERETINFKRFFIYVGYNGSISC